jgi:hypothetical protein
LDESCRLQVFLGGFAAQKYLPLSPIAKMEETVGMGSDENEWVENHSNLPLTRLENKKPSWEGGLWLSNKSASF